MSKTLQVVVPFFVLEEGDTLELTADGKNYVSEYREEFNKTDDENGDVQSTYSSKFSISLDYAKELIKDGFLKEVKQDSEFKNVFDEINKLIETYENELKNTDEQLPNCVKLEKTTVLCNLLKVLNHLKSLKK